MKKKIEDLTGIEIVGGQIITRLIASKGEQGHEIGTIVAKTIRDGFVSSEDIMRIRYKTEPDVRRLTKEGDIVFKLVQPFSACRIEKADEGLLVSSFCAIIRNIDKEEIDPDYLLAYFNSEQGNAQVLSKMGGSTIQTISMKGIRSIVIPVPSREIQAEIGEAFSEKVSMSKLMAKMARLQEEKLNAMISEVEE